MSIELEIGNNLLQLRTQRGLSTKELANFLEISRYGYSNYEKGIREVPVTVLLKLSRLYNLSIDELVLNPNIIGRSKVLSFTTYKVTDDGVVPVDPIILTSERDDKIFVKNGEEYLVFQKCDNFLDDTVMLFEYANKTYVSKILFFEDESVLFFSGDKPVQITKKQARFIGFLGGLIYEIKLPEVSVIRKI